MTQSFDYLKPDAPVAPAGNGS